MNQKCQLYLYSTKIHLLNPDVSARVPDLRTLQTVPAEGEDVVSASEAPRNLDQVLEGPPISSVQVFRNVDFRPF